LFTNEERLNENDAWYCPSCKQHKQASKQLDLFKLPKILIIHLKRFSYAHHLWREKIDIDVFFPLEKLDLSRFVTSQKEDAIYDLFAVSNHIGGFGGGHYIAKVKNPSDQRWYLFDDSIFREISTSEVHSREAYILFYERRSSDISILQ